MNPIRTLRAQLGLTQADLAKPLGVSQGNVSLYEGGQTMPPEVAKKLIAYARSCGLDVGYEAVYGPPPELATPKKKRTASSEGGV